MGREHLHLNLALREVQDYVIDLVGGWIEELDLKWGRWDYNIWPIVYWEKHDPSGKFQFRYVEGLYRVLDTLMRRYPDWVVECCSSGGRRIDLSTLRRAHTAWFSDHTDNPHVCRYMQTGTSRFLPGNYLNSAVPTRVGEGGCGLSTLDFLSRMCGTFLLSGDVASWPEELVRGARQLIEVYKSIRHLLVQDFYPLTPHPRSPEDWDVVEFASYDWLEPVVFFFRVEGDLEERSFKLRGLAPRETCQVVDPIDGALVAEATGEELMERGLTMGLRPSSAALGHV